jgi:8-oxo-dGTP diphosphatase
MQCASVSVRVLLDEHFNVDAKEKTGVIKMSIGQFYAGIAALVWSPITSQYLLLRRSDQKDYGRGIWECVTGRVDQGEGFEEAMHREVREELGIEVQVEYILGTTHFYRGDPKPENEMVGVIYMCALDETSTISIGPEHSEFRWLSANEALLLLSASDPSTQWIKRVIERAETVRPWLPADLVKIARQTGFEFG